MPINIPEIPLVPQPTTAEAIEAVGYQYNEEAGKRHKLGGCPDWQQNSEWPLCECCDESMTFYGQLDSIGDNYDLADCGIIYVFVCFNCFTTTSILHPN